MALAIFAASILPGLVYLDGLYRYDRCEPEPRGWVALIFFLGMGAANIAVAASYPLIFVGRR